LLKSDDNYSNQQVHRFGTLHFVTRIIFILFLMLNFQLSYTQSVEDYSLKTVVIDAGHGGRDPGALGKRSKEKDITLAIALKLGAYIKKSYPEVKVYYTRMIDKFVELHQRSMIANEKNADLFISIHANANPNKTVVGTSTYVMGIHKVEDNLDVAILENSAILLEDNYSSSYEGFDPNSSETHIMLSLMANIYLDQSLLFATKIQKQLTNRAHREDLGVKQAGLVVLWNTISPSVLIETGFITNTTEEKFLRSKAGQELIASAIFRAFKEYKAGAEGKTKDPEPKKVTQKAPRSKESKISLKVQIKSSPTHLALDPKNFKGLKGIEEIKHLNRFKYLIGDKKTLEDIQIYQKEIRKTYPDAFVVALKDGTFISFSEALEELKK
jgi:N-acetylmuramoyl-L-alanine amidase